MSERTSNASSEAPSLLIAEVNQEGHVREINIENLAVPENINGQIVRFIKDGLTPEFIRKQLDDILAQPEVQRQLINELSPYSEQINTHIRTTQELFVYMQNGLQEATILGRPCLLMKIDPERKDAMGRSNAERMAVGLSPIDENGDIVNLHHIGQKEDSPLAELPDRVHKEYDAILHDKSKPTEVHGEGNNWNQERAQYWRERSKTL